MGRPPGSTWVFQNFERRERRGLVICLAEQREGRREQYVFSVVMKGAIYGGTVEDGTAVMFVEGDWAEERGW